MRSGDRPPDGGERDPASGLVSSFGLVVPLYNEEGRFPEFGPVLVEFVEGLPEGSEVVFVDDGSHDRTVELVSELVRERGAGRARLLQRPHEGKGAAVAAGLRTLRTDYAGFCDLDLSTPLDDILRLLRIATTTQALVIGSRDLATSHVAKAESRTREALGRTYNRLLQAVLVPGVVDTQCGAKVASRRVWDAVLPYSHEYGFAWDAEIIAIARRLAIPVQEVPVTWRHDERSTVHVARDGTAMVWAVGRIWRNVHALDHGARGSRAEIPEAASRNDAWWRRSAAALVATAIRRTRPAGAEPGWLVDIGGGSGRVTMLLGWDPERSIVVDPDTLLLRHARLRARLGGIAASLDALPLASGSAEVVTLLDLERIEHLDVALGEAARLVGTEGRVIVFAPLDPNGPAATSGATSLDAALARVGLRPTVRTRCFSWLTRKRAYDPEARRAAGARFQRAALFLTAFERFFVTRAPLPFGTALLIVAEPTLDRFEAQEALRSTPHRD